MRTLHSEHSSRGDYNPTPEESDRAERQTIERRDDQIRAQGGIPWSQDEKSQPRDPPQSEIDSICRSLSRW